MATYNKTKSGAYVIEQLEKEINENAVIVPALQYVTADGENITLEFTASLSGAEETELDTVITNHVPDEQSIGLAALPLSEIDGKKLAVHTSSKPYVEGKRTYAVWTGCGDDIAGDDIGDGPMVHLDSEVGTEEKSVDVKFLPTAGRVWIHEGYLLFSGGGEGDYMSADIRSEATALQTLSNLDYELEDNGKGSNWVKLAAGGPGTGTHGFAGQPVLLPRTFSGDGYWDYDGETLTPNVGGTGKYHISDGEMIVHRYINRIPCTGDSYGYFTMSSNETTELPVGYYMRIHQHNVSDTVWHASVIMEIYRERTHDP